MTKEEVLSKFGEGSGEARVAAHFYDGIYAAHKRIDDLEQGASPKTSDAAHLNHDEIDELKKRIDKLENSQAPKKTRRKHEEPA